MFYNIFIWNIINTCRSILNDVQVTLSKDDPVFEDLFNHANTYKTKFLMLLFIMHTQLIVFIIPANILYCVMRFTCYINDRDYLNLQVWLIDTKSFAYEWSIITIFKRKYTRLFWTVFEFHNQMLNVWFFYKCTLFCGENSLPRQRCNKMAMSRFKWQIYESRIRKNMNCTCLNK